MGLTPEQFNRVAENEMSRRLQGLPPLVPRRDSEESATPDQEDPPPISLSMVRQALRDCGISEEAINAMSRDQLRAEQAKLRSLCSVLGFKRSTVDVQKKKAGNETPVADIHQNLRAVGRRIAAGLLLRRYRYAGVMFIGIGVGALITTFWPADSYSDCILKHIDHAGSRMAVSVTQRACAAKFPPTRVDSNN